MAGASEQRVRRVVTGVDAQGRSAVTVDETCQKIAVDPQYVTVDLWASGLPAATDGSVDVPAVADVDGEPGVLVWRWFSLGPGERIAFHATETVDCLLVYSGRITMQLETGDVQLERGDCVVQRGTRHGWVNDSHEECVLVGTMASTVAG